MSTVDKGHARERQWMKRLEDEGWFACRPRWATADVLAGKEGRWVMDEVKSNEGNPFKNFGPLKRLTLLALADKAGAEARLVHWPNRSEPRVIPSSEWP